MRKKIKNQFTLIEVTVVLLVLVALAGVVVPLALGYAQRSHGSTGAGNIAQLTANINRFETENFQMPNGWDSLIDGATNLPFDGALTAFTLDTDGSGTDAERKALTDAGITSVFDLEDQDSPNGEYTTFGSNGALGAETIIAGTILAQIAGTDVRNALGASNDPADTYIALGIGENLTAIGKTITTAPYDFPEGAEKPEESYKRFIAIFNVSGDKAKFIGVVAAHDGEISNIQDHINEYYEATE